MLEDTSADYIYSERHLSMGIYNPACSVIEHRIEKRQKYGG